MTNQIYSTWLFGVLASISWYGINIGLMGLLLPEKKIGSFFFWLFFILGIWIMGWRSEKLKNLIIGKTKERKKVFFGIFLSMGAILIYALDQIKSVAYETSIRTKHLELLTLDDSFYLWRTWTANVGLLLVIFFIIINVIVIIKKK